MTRKLTELSTELIKIQMVIACGDMNTARSIAIILIMKFLTPEQLKKLADFISKSSEAIENKDPKWIEALTDQLQ